MHIPRYYEALDFPALWREFPSATEFLETTAKLSRDALRALQEERFLAQMRRAWMIPFYQRHWGDAGMQPGDITGLESLSNIPTFSVHNLRDALARNPPWGDFMGIDPLVDAPISLVLQTANHREPHLLVLVDVYALAAPPFGGWGLRRRTT